MFFDPVRCRCDFDGCDVHKKSRAEEDDHG